MFWGKVFTGVYIDFARHFLPQKLQNGQRIPEVVITLRCFFSFCFFQKTTSVLVDDAFVVSASRHGRLRFPLSQFIFASGCVSSGLRIQI